MRHSKILFYVLVMTVGSVLVTSCSQGVKDESSGDDDTEMQADHRSTEGEEQSHQHSDHEQSITTDGATILWSPTGEGEALIRKDFHFLSGAMENITPEVVSNEAEELVLKLTADGVPTCFVFHQSYGNIGISALVDTKDFGGTFSVVHHAQNPENLEFVAITDGSMQLGRVVDGGKKVFDEATFQSTDPWSEIRVSAAGTHFKGYIGEENITHGHGEVMKDGFAGIMLEGKGTVLIRSIELTPLEEE